MAQNDPIVIVLSKESELQSRPLLFLKDKENFHIKRAFHPNQSTVIKLGCICYVPCSLLTQT